MSFFPRLIALTGLLTLIVGIASSQNSDPSMMVGSSAQPRLQVGSAGEMIGFAGTSESGQIITVIHTGKSWMSVYHVAQNGEIRLTSSRPIDADFSLQLNATTPLPEDIRRAVGRSNR